MSAFLVLKGAIINQEVDFDPTQGVVLFGQNQSSLLYAVSGILTGRVDGPENRPELVAYAIRSDLLGLLPIPQESEPAMQTQIC
jgi:hypothetical protein